MSDYPPADDVQMQGAKVENPPLHQDQYERARSPQQGGDDRREQDDHPRDDRDDRRDDDRRDDRSAPPRE